MSMQVKPSLPSDYRNLTRIPSNLVSKIASVVPFRSSLSLSSTLILRDQWRAKGMLKRHSGPGLCLLALLMSFLLSTASSFPTYRLHVFSWPLNLSIILCYLTSFNLFHDNYAVCQRGLQLPSCGLYSGGTRGTVECKFW